MPEIANTISQCLHKSDHHRMSHCYSIDGHVKACRDDWSGVSGFLLPPPVSCSNAIHSSPSPTL